MQIQASGRLDYMTQTFHPVPEPSTLTLTAVGVLACFSFLLQRERGDGSLDKRHHYE
jgi:hypothetical protein